VDTTNKKAGIDRLTGVVLRSLDGDQTTADLARLAYQSRTQFHRLLRAIVDETPAAMRRRLRLERAAFQLRCGESSVTNVAFDANYGSLEAFTRAFRSAFGVSPSIYRRIASTEFTCRRPTAFTSMRQVLPRESRRMDSMIDLRK
jgi:AraC family transcriptional regulator